MIVYTTESRAAFITQPAWVATRESARRVLFYRTRVHFPFSHGKSVTSCCHKLGAIALLDLRNAARPLVARNAWSNWTTFLDNHKPITILLDIDPAYLTERLYDYDSMQQRFPYATMVAEAEKCYPGPICIEAVRRCVLICANWRSLFRIISGHEITDADFSEARRSFDAKLKKIGWKEPPAWCDILDTDVPTANETNDDASGPTIE